MKFSDVCPLMITVAKGEVYSILSFFCLMGDYNGLCAAEMNNVLNWFLLLLEECLPLKKLMDLDVLWKKSPFLFCESLT